jgi:hypothetical protein
VGRGDASGVNSRGWQCAYPKVKDVPPVRVELMMRAAFLVMFVARAAVAARVRLARWLP